MLWIRLTFSAVPKFTIPVGFVTGSQKLLNNNSKPCLWSGSAANPAPRPASVELPGDCATTLIVWKMMPQKNTRNMFKYNNKQKETKSRFALPQFVLIRSTLSDISSKTTIKKQRENTNGPARCSIRFAKFASAAWFINFLAAFVLVDAYPIKLKCWPRNQCFTSEVQL